MNREPSNLTNTEPDAVPGNIGLVDRWRRRGRRFFRWSLILALVLLVVHVGMSVWSNAALKRSVALVEERGESLEFRDYHPVGVEDRMNASHYLDAIGNLYKVLADEQRAAGSGVTGADGKPLILMTELSKTLHQLVVGRTPSEAENLALFREVHEHFSPLYDIFDQARHLERARYSTHYSGVLAIEYRVPSLIPRMNLARLLAARAIVAIHEGRTDDAYRDAADIFRLASWMDQETPSLIGKIMVGTIADQGCQTLNQLVRVSPPGPQAEALVRGAVGRLDPEAIYRRALVIERAAMFSTMVDVDFDFLPYEPANRLAAATFSDGMTRAMDDAALPAWQREPVTDWDLYDKRYFSGLFSWPARMMVIDCFNIADRRDELQVRFDLLDYSLRLDAWRRIQGAFPERLDLLGDPQPMDPFSGEPYRYRLEDGGYLLYSVSSNRTDDGGAALGKFRKGGDLVWRIR